MHVYIYLYKNSIYVIHLYHYEWPTGGWKKLEVRVASKRLIIGIYDDVYLAQPTNNASTRIHIEGTRCLYTLVFVLDVHIFSRIT